MAPQRASAGSDETSAPARAVGSDWHAHEGGGMAGMKEGVVAREPLGAATSDPDWSVMRAGDARRAGKLVAG